MHSDQEEGYSSFSDTDVEGAEGRTQASAPWLGTTAAAASYHAWPPGTRGARCASAFGNALVRCCVPVRTLCPHSLYSRVFHQVADGD